MALLPILQFPDPRLKLVAKPVETFDAHTAKICDDLFETMYEANGVGLAAIQANIPQRIIVVDTSEDQSAGICLINPKLINAESEIIWEEGCLSFPGVFAKVKRSAKITVEYYNQKGQLLQLHAEELTAVCIQHEIDHLNGISFYDHLSPLKQKLIRKKLEKIRDKAL